MNADNGSAIFGKKTADKNSGQIILDPSNNKALLFSSNYFDNYKEDGLPSSYSKPSETYEKDGQTYYYQGMLIDLTTPQIRFRSGKFEVNSEGHLTAKGGGSIAGWNISDTQLKSYNNTVILNSGAIQDSDIVFKAGSQFSVQADGTLNASNGTFNGTISASSISGGSISGATITGGSLNIGSGTFKVTSSGALTATDATITGYISSKEGYIGGWTIGSNYLSGTGVKLSSNGLIEVNGASNGGLYIYNSTTKRAFRFYENNDLWAEIGTWSGSSTTDALTILTYGQRDIRLTCGRLLVNGEELEAVARFG